MAFRIGRDLALDRFNRGWKPGIQNRKDLALASFNRGMVLIVQKYWKMLCTIMNAAKQHTLALHSRVQLKMDLQPTGFLTQEKEISGRLIAQSRC